MKDFDNTHVLQLVRKYALFNAVKYGKSPLAGSVVGRLMAEHPELRACAREVAELVNRVVSEISAGSNDEWKRELSEVAPELLFELGEKKEPSRGLPPLPEAERVVMRFAPNPNGPPTLGSARGIIVNSEYAKRYKGRFILRFDDTDPKNKRPLREAYEWYVEDCRWLGAEPDEVVIASERMEIYYDYAEKLIELGGAYVCCCTQEEFKKYKDSARACPHREQSVEVNLEMWEEMLEGGYDAGGAVLRVKTDITHRDPAIRDWAAFRIIDVSHPRAGDRYRVWPLLDFESAVEDHILGITHIIRGKDLMDSERRQKYIYQYFNWEYPLTLHWGRVKIHEFGKLSTSGIGEAIGRGEYTGWDDPRLPTIRALRRRGIQAEALRSFFVNLGVDEADISLSMENLYAENRKMVDATAKRYFFTPEPVKLSIQRAKPTVAKPLLHPSQNWGHRSIPVEGEVFIARDDADTLREGEVLRLKDLYNIQILEIHPEDITAAYVEGGVEVIRKNQGRIIHWAPRDGVSVTVLKPDGVDMGVGERGICDALGEVVQFERYGFVRVDSIKESTVTVCFAHK
jgi:glutamyl-tRNA synthetase